MVERVLKADGTEESSRRAGVRYKMVAPNTYCECSAAENARRDADEARSAAWRAVKQAHPGREFTTEERRAFKAAFAAGQTYTPGPASPTLAELVAAEVARQLAGRTR